MIKEHPHWNDLISPQAAQLTWQGGFSVETDNCL